MSLPVPARVYLWLMVLAAAGLQLYWLRAWPGPLPTNLGLMVVLVGLAVVAQHFSLLVGPRDKVDVSIAVYFACLLLFGAAVATALVGASELLGQGTLAMRRNPLSGRRRRGVHSVLFNTSQFMLVTALGGLVYYRLVPPQVPAPLDRVENWWAVPAAAGALYLANSGSVALMAGLQRAQRPNEIWLTGHGRGVLQFSGLFLIGLLTARVAIYDPWIVLVMVLPAASIHLSLKRTVELIEQTVFAMESMADEVDRRDRYTFGHSKRVAACAEGIARQLRLPGKQIEAIRLAARVHDLGKIEVPDRVLLKPGGLTPEEWVVMKQHPQVGYEILSQFPQYALAKELVASHHERFDGSGYPHGLEGHQILLGAQIIAVADALDAMTSDRAYRPALTVHQAMAELRRLKCIQWHPQVVEALESMVAQEGKRVLISAPPAG